MMADGCKVLIVIPDGAVDEPQASLSGLTPLEAARIPGMSAIAREGLVGTANTIPPGFEPGSDVATLSLLGYDPKAFHTGRAPIEAAARRIPLSSDDWVFRCNLVTVSDGQMVDHSAGNLSQAEGEELIADVAKALGQPGLEFHQGVGYRHLMVWRNAGSLDVTTTPPHEILGDPAGDCLPQGKDSLRLREIMAKSAGLLARHPINLRRVAKGLRPATQAWFWGQGRAPHLPTFAQRFGVPRGCMIAGVDLLRGLGELLGWENRSSPGMTSYHDTNYAAQGAATCEALKEFDIVVSHVEATDEASHQGDAATKVASLEAIDRHIVVPAIAAIRQYPEWRIMVMPDHPTLLRTRKHEASATCFAVAGTGITPGGAAAFSEKECRKGKLIEPAYDLMPSVVLRNGR